MTDGETVQIATNEHRITADEVRPALAAYLTAQTARAALLDELRLLRQKEEQAWAQVDRTQTLAQELTLRYLSLRGAPALFFMGYACVSRGAALVCTKGFELATTEDGGPGPPEGEV